MRRRMSELWAMLLLDRKRAGLLCLLFVGLLFSVGRVIVDAGPSRASARERTDAGGIPGMAGSFSAVTVEDLRMSGPTIDVERPAPISRNLFAYDRSYFPEPPQEESTVQVAPKSPLGTDDTTGSEDRSEFERAVERVRMESSGLRLRSTMLGARPVAVIEWKVGKQVSSEVIHPGGSVAGFEVVQVRAQSVLLSKDGVMVELQREKPQN